MPSFQSFLCPADDVGQPGTERDKQKDGFVKCRRYAGTRSLVQGTRKSRVAGLFNLSYISCGFVRQPSCFGLRRTGLFEPLAVVVVKLAAFLASIGAGVLLLAERHSAESAAIWAASLDPFVLTAGR